MRQAILGIPVDQLTMEQAVQEVLLAAQEHRHMYVCFVNVHSIGESHRNKRIETALKQADLNLPDGMPVARLMSDGGRQQARIPGPDFVEEICKVAAARALSIGIYGGSSRSVFSAKEKLLAKYPGLHIGLSYSPPIMDRISKSDVEGDLIRSSGCDILLVCLGSPKQEIWMNLYTNDLRMPMLGVGAAVDFVAGTVRRAPLWMQRSGLEWIYRIAQEPRRLWARYLRDGLSVGIRLLFRMVRRA